MHHRPRVADPAPLDLVDALQELAKARRLANVRVKYKRSSRGQHAIAVIFPAEPT